MSIQVQCIQCHSTHKVNDRLAGRHVRCPSCSATIQIPAAVKSLTVWSEAQDDNVVYDADDDLFKGVEGDFLDHAPANQESFNDQPQTPQPAAMDDFDDDNVMPPRQKREDDELDMTPMVDVTFLLLIFFMVTASFSLQKSIEMPRQQTDAPSTSTTDEEPEELDQVEVQVDEYGSFLVLAADWEKETPGKQNLISALKESLTAGSDGTRLSVKVHELAKLQALVDAMDAGTIAGFTQIEVTQVEDFD